MDRWKEFVEDVESGLARGDGPRSFVIERAYDRFRSPEGEQMTPIIERLRSGFGGIVPPLCDEAANFIEHLQQEVEQARAEAYAADKLSVERQADVEREWKRAKEAQLAVHELAEALKLLKEEYSHTHMIKSRHAVWKQARAALARAEEVLK